MKKTLRNILFVTALSPLLMQCASQDEVQRLQYQLHVVNKKLAQMQSTTVGDIQKRQAASSNQMDELGSEILNLKSQLEETNNLNRNLTEQNKELQTNIGAVAKEEAEQREEALRRIEEEQQAKEARIADLTDKLNSQQASLQAIQESRVREAERRAQEARAKADAAKAKSLAASSSSLNSSAAVVKITPLQGKRVVTASSQSSASETQTVSQPVATTSKATDSTSATQATTQPAASTAANKPARVAEPVQAAAPTPETTGGSPLADAEQLYQQKQYDKAYAEYEKVASVDPASNSGISAGYMMGECLFAQKEYDKAILQYQKIISQNGTHPKAASATLKQAMAFELLADNETARMIYKKIVNHYGSSPEAKTAKEKLGNL